VWGAAPGRGGGGAFLPADGHPRDGHLLAGREAVRGRGRDRHGRAGFRRAADGDPAERGGHAREGVLQEELDPAGGRAEGRVAVDGDRVGRGRVEGDVVRRGRECGRRVGGGRHGRRALTRGVNVVAVVDGNDVLRAGGGERGGEGGHGAAVQRRRTDEVGEAHAAVVEAHRPRRRGDHGARDGSGQGDRDADGGGDEAAGDDGAAGRGAGLEHLHGVGGRRGEGRGAAAGEVGRHEVVADQGRARREGRDAAGVDRAGAEDRVGVQVGEGDRVPLEPGGADLRVAQGGGEGDLGARG